MEWRAMIYAPKDGRVIIGLFNDGSGVCAIRWGLNTKDNEEKWFYSDFSDEAGVDFAGFIECPQTEIWNTIGEK